MPAKFEQPHKESPFREPLVASEIHPDKGEKLRELRGIPDKIIRSIPLERLQETYHIERLPDKRDNMKQLVKAASEAKRLFDELKSQYNIHVSADFVVGNDAQGLPSLYIVADRIDGANPRTAVRSEDAEANAHIRSVMQELFLSLANYFRDKYVSGDAFLYDISKYWQYVYGKKAGEGEAQMYLVDLDPGLVALESRIDKEVTASSADKREGHMMYFVVNLLQTIEIFERDLNTRFEDVRAELQDIFNRISERGLRNESLDMLKNGVPDEDPFPNG